MMEPARLRLIAQELQLAHSERLDPVLFHGRSMPPFVGGGDDLTGTPVRWEDIRRGDIITYRSQDKSPPRRVVAQLPTSLRLRADNWAGLEYVVDRAEVLGRVVARG